MVYEAADIFGNVQPQQMKLPTKPTGGTRRTTMAEQLRQQVPLTNLDDWLTFAEALIGRADVDENTERFFARDFTNLDEMSDFEQKLDGVIGVDSPWTLVRPLPLAPHRRTNRRPTGLLPLGTDLRPGVRQGRLRPSGREPAMGTA